MFESAKWNSLRLVAALAPTLGLLALGLLKACASSTCLDASRLFVMLHPRRFMKNQHCLRRISTHALTPTAYCQFRAHGYGSEPHVATRINLECDTHRLILTQVASL
eukprot:1176367-Prorocentrum_minimum.AAC.1